MQHLPIPPSDEARRKSARMTLNAVLYAALMLPLAGAVAVYLGNVEPKVIFPLFGGLIVLELVSYAVLRGIYRRQGLLKEPDDEQSTTL